MAIKNLLLILSALTLAACGLAQKGDEDAPVTKILFYNQSDFNVVVINYYRQGKDPDEDAVYSELPDFSQKLDRAILNSGESFKIDIPPEYCDWNLELYAVFLDDNEKSYSARSLVYSACGKTARCETPLTNYKGELERSTNCDFLAFCPSVLSCIDS